MLLKNCVSKTTLRRSPIYPALHLPALMPLRMSVWLNPSVCFSLHLSLRGNLFSAFLSIKNPPACLSDWLACVRFHTQYLKIVRTLAAVLEFDSIPGCRSMAHLPAEERDKLEQERNKVCSLCLQFSFALLKQNGAFSQVNQKKKTKY